MTATHTELNVLDGVTAGTVTASKGVVVDSSSKVDVWNVDNLVINGNSITAGTGAVNIVPAAGSAVLIDGTLSIDAGVVTGATSVTSTVFVGDITGDVTGNADTATSATTAGTVTTAAQTNITSLGTLTALQVDNLNVNGNTIISTDTAGDINITPDTTGDIVLDAQKWPQADGSVNQLLSTDGAGQLSWATPATTTVLTTQGDVLFQDASGLQRLGTGTNGQVLTSGGAGADLTWETSSGSDVTTKGDLQGYGSAGARIPVGADGTKLVSDSSDTEGVSWVPDSGARNFIIDGDFTQYPQGNITAIANSAYGAALWENFHVGGELVLDIDQLSDAPTVAESGHSSTYSMSLDVTTAETAVAAGDYQVVEYKVTGSDFAQLDQQQVTLSFWHKHTKTGTFCGYFSNSASDRSYVYEYTQSTTNTWEKHTETVTLDTSGTWLLTDADIGLRVGFCSYGGATFQGTADTWEGAKDYCTSNQVAGMDNATNFCKFAQVGLYLGPTAPTFTSPPIAVVRDQVDYYVQEFDFTNTSNEPITMGWTPTGGVHYYYVHFRKEFRATPTVIEVSAVGTYRIWYDNTNTVATSYAQEMIGKNTMRFRLSGGAGTAGNAAAMTRDTTDTTRVVFDARH
jgi:hypothetical protein